MSRRPLTQGKHTLGTATTGWQAEVSTLAGRRTQGETAFWQGTEYFRLDKAEFAPILALAEPLLTEARRLAEWAHDGQLDNTGADMLLQLAEHWQALESVLEANCMGVGYGRWYVEDDRVYRAASCLHDLAHHVRENADWLQYLPDITNTCLLSLAPDACMGMPHTVFAKRLAVAVELLQKIVAPTRQESNDHTDEEGDPDHSPRVVLRGREEGPLVLGKTKHKLTTPQYNVVEALRDAGDRGLTKDELVNKSTHGDARGIMKRLADSDPDWNEVIHFAGQTGGRYRIK